jgi:Zn-dependent M28 family amino/carboxypeptidase
VLPGSDPALRDEFVVLSAHIDHLGKGLEAGEDGGDRIYNGAMDNAAGTATLLELAQRLAEEKTRLKRSVLFLLVTGEEQGLLGSRYFAAFPTVPQKKLVANLNADMFLPIIPMKSLRVLGLEESTLGEAVRRVGDEMNVRVHGDPEPLRNSFIRSDQYSFVRAGIPALALDVGYETDTAEHKVIREWLRERYHAPSDDLSQPVDLEAAALYNDVFLRVTAEVANAAERPRWLETSFFRRFAQDAPASGAQR